MNIKTFMATAVTALTLAACTAEEPTPTVTTDEAVNEQSANDEVTAPEFEVSEPTLATPPV
jgi:hypothetical protein